MLRYEEGVLHIACGVIGSKVHTGEHMQVVLYLGTVGQHESHATEDIDNLVGHNGQGVACTQLDGVGRACQVDGLVARLLCGACLAQGVDTVCDALFQFVDFHAHLFLLFCGHVAEVLHQLVQFTILTQVLQSELLYFLSILCLQRVNLLKEFVYLFKYHFIYKIAICVQR